LTAATAAAAANATSGQTREIHYRAIRLRGGPISCDSQTRALTYGNYLPAICGECHRAITRTHFHTAILGAHLRGTRYDHHFNSGGHRSCCWQRQQTCQGNCFGPFVLKHDWTRSIAKRNSYY
jgi:hypothetical protein